MTAVNLSEEALLQGLIQRDTKVMELVYDKYAPALYGFLYEIVHDEEVAGQLLQECFYTAWHSAGAGRPIKGRLFTWLFFLARQRVEIYDAAHLVSVKSFVARISHQPI